MRRRAINPEKTETNNSTVSKISQDVHPYHQIHFIMKEWGNNAALLGGSAMAGLSGAGQSGGAGIGSQWS
jgi:hypothetical protein